MSVFGLATIRELRTAVGGQGQVQIDALTTQVTALAARINALTAAVTAADLHAATAYEGILAAITDLKPTSIGIEVPFTIPAQV